MRRFLLVLSLGAALAVAGRTVELEIGARIGRYELARVQRKIDDLSIERDALRVRVAAIWVPEAVVGAAVRLRDAERMRHERAAAAAKAEGTLAQL